MGTTPDFDQWVAARGPSLLRLAYVLTGSQEDAEDLVQHALSRALPRWSRISGLDDPDASVRRMVVNAHVSRRRFARRETPAPTLVDVVVTTGIAIADHDVVWQAFQSLPPDQRTAIVLRLYEDLEHAEIAELTGVREGNVRSRVSGGIAAVRAELGESDDDFETRLRDSLAERAEDARSPSGLAAGARARLRRRRTTIARVVAGSAALAALALGIAFVDLDSDARPRPPQAPEVPYVVRDLAPDFVPDVRTARDSMQQVQWRRIRFMVPVEWQPGVPTAWCKEGKDPAAVVPRIALPGEKTPKAACAPTSGYGVTVGSAAGFDPVHDSRYVWQYDADGRGARAGYPDNAWLSSWYDDEWVVTIVTPDPGLTSRIAQSVRRDEVDANGCAAVYDELAVRTTKGPRGVGAALCRYSTDGELEVSRRLSYVEVDAALAALAAAPDLPGGDHCIQQVGGWVTLTPAGGSAYLARYGTQGLGSCQDGVESTAQEQERGPRGYVELTPAVRSALGLDDVE